MIKKLIYLLIVSQICVKVVHSQRTTLPVDWRQHNLPKYNANLFNPALSFVRYETKNLSVWGRLQWVGVEDSPTTYLINYGGRFGKQSGAGIALFQHNIGLFTDSGLMVNYARGIRLARESWLAFGINVVGLRRGLNQASFITPEPDPVLQNSDQDFILAVMPGINLTVNAFNFGIMSENLLDYNFTISDQQTDFSDKIFLGYVSHDYKLKGGVNSPWRGTFFRTTVYGKTIPDQDFQYGAQAYIDVPQYGWAQVGYNNFYGISGGIGTKVAPGIAIGFVVETGTNLTRAFGATYEVNAAIEFGGKSSKNNRDKPISFKEGPKPKKKEKIKKTTATKAANDKAKNEQNISTSKSTDSKKTIKNDSISVNAENIGDLPIEKLKNINRDTDKTVLNNVFKSNNVNPRYKVVDRIEGVEYGFYLVVNVFSQKKYYDLFMRLLSNQGLNPKSFFNPTNNYYYVYLRKYDRLSDVERDRRTQYNGKYKGETWILWVKNN